MQVEKRVREVNQNGKEWFKSIFEKPEPYDPKKLENYFENPEVEEVHVFNATPINMKMAKLRQQYPGTPRRELRKMLKKMK